MNSSLRGRRNLLSNKATLFDLMKRPQEKSKQRSIAEMLTMKMPPPAKPRSVAKVIQRLTETPLPVVGAQALQAFQKAKCAEVASKKAKAKAKAKAKSQGTKKDGKAVKDKKATFHHPGKAMKVMSHIGIGIPEEAWPQSKKRGQFSYTIRLGPLAVEVQVKNRAYYLKQGTADVEVTRRTWTWSSFESPALCWEALKERAGFIADAA